MGEYKKSGGFGGRGGGGRGGFSRGGGRPSFGGGRPDFNRGGRDGRAEMFSATCVTCRKACEVPFRPSGDKPVYCNDCFRSHRESPRTEYTRQDARERDTREAPRRFPASDFVAVSSAKPQGDDKRIDELKRQLEAVNVKLDKIMQIIVSTMPAPISAVKQEREKRTATPLKTLIANAVEPVKKADKKANTKADKKTAKKKPAAKKGKK